MKDEEALEELRTGPHPSGHEIADVLEGEIERLRGIISRNKAAFEAMKADRDQKAKDARIYREWYERAKASDPLGLRDLFRR